MKPWIKIASLAMVMGLLAECIEPFDPPRGSVDNLLVVEGHITDNRGSNFIRISRTTPIDTIYYAPETGAEVTVVDNDNVVTSFQETAPGVYQTLSFEFQGEVGKTYQLKIKTESGQELESTKVLLKKSPEIDSIHWKLKDFYNESGRLIEGLDILVSTHDPEANTRFYRWEWEETWEFSSAFESLYEYIDDSIVVRTEQINDCWRSNESSTIEVGTSKGLTQDMISGYKLHHLTNETNHLRRKYSINVKQYALDEESFLYWQQLKDINENVGSLFDAQPSTIIGNITNVSNPSEPVLGYFDASTISEKRFFIQRYELPDTWRIPRGYEFCRYDSVAIPDLQEYINFGWLFISEIRGMTGNITGYTMATEYCVDCRLVGTTERPPFWQ
jgi:hypothetical protein